MTVIPYEREIKGKAASTGRLLRILHARDGSGGMWWVCQNGTFMVDGDRWVRAVPPADAVTSRQIRDDFIRSIQ